MELKCVVIRAELEKILHYRQDRDFVFLLTPSDEEKLGLALDERAGRSETLVSATLFRNQENQLTAQEMHEVVRLLAGAAALVVSTEVSALDQVAELVCEANSRGVRVMELTEALLELDPRVPIDRPELVQALVRCSVHQGVSYRAYSAVKDVLEPVLAATLLMLLSPIVLLTALMVKLTSPGPVFYKQTRLGLRRELFDIIKFRSMRVDAESNGPVWAAASKSDSRLTPIGGFLRATHLDEIPQIWNVVRGELSFTGPRPERPIFCQELEQTIPLFRMRTLVKPGITGWAQVRAGYANSVNDSKRKLEFDLYYMLKRSPWMDLKIVVDTLVVLMSGGSEGRKRELTEATAGARRRAALPTSLTRRPLAAPVESATAVQAEIS
jgi:lipopolysaccharide/colanic/teichoic acid biosynthesis glycosyltransferase